MARLCPLVALFMLLTVIGPALGVSVDLCTRNAAAAKPQVDAFLACQDQKMASGVDPACCYHLLVFDTSAECFGVPEFESILEEDLKPKYALSAVRGTCSVAPTLVATPIPTNTTSITSPADVISAGTPTNATSLTNIGQASPIDMSDSNGMNITNNLDNSTGLVDLFNATNRPGNESTLPLVKPTNETGSADQADLVPMASSEDDCVAAADAVRQQATPLKLCLTNKTPENIAQCCTEVKALKDYPSCVDNTRFRAEADAAFSPTTTLDDIKRACSGSGGGRRLV